jgi:ADP-ribose pyrophosphatase YjhB (NUDIX family)
MTTHEQFAEAIKRQIEEHLNQKVGITEISLTVDQGIRYPSSSVFAVRFTTHGALYKDDK